MAESPILFVSKDLIFLSKVTGTACELNRPVRVVGSVAEALAALDDQTDLVIVDLGDPASATADQLKQLRAALPQDARLIAYGSHVDVQRLQTAREAGCDPVLPRSQFTNLLPSLLG